MKYLKYFESSKILVGYRCQFDSNKLTKTINQTATEGEGWYISKTLEFAESFQDENNSLFRVEFKYPRKILMAGSLLTEGFLGWDYPESKIRQPLKDTDNDWLKYHKISVANSSNKKEAIEYFTKLLLDMGYDAIEVNEDEDEEWYVLLKEDMILKYEKIKQII